MKTAQFLKKFAREYYKTNNARQSAINAGWLASTAQARCTTLLSNVVVLDELKRMEQEAKEKFELSEEKIVRELMKIGFANTKDFMNYGATGEITFTPLNELSDDQSAAISEVTNSKKYDKDGNQLGVDVKLKMNDKL